MTWVELADTPAVKLHGLYVSPNGLHVWVVGRQGTVLESLDGGVSWLDRSEGFGRGYLTSVRFTADGQSGWIAGEDGLMFATVDGGTTWYEQDTGVSKKLYLGATENGSAAYASGVGGVVLRAVR